MNLSDESSTETDRVSLRRKVIRLPADIDRVLERDSTLSDIAYDMLIQSVPRRKLIDWISERVDHFKGDIVYADGRTFRTYPGEIDDAFGDEPSMRWFTDLNRFLYERPRQRPQRRVKQRLLLLIIALTNERCFGPAGFRKEPSRDMAGFGYALQESPEAIEAKPVPRPEEWGWQSLPCGGECRLLDLKKNYAWKKEFSRRTDDLVARVLADPRWADEISRSFSQK